MGNFFSSNAAAEAPPEEAPVAGNGRVQPSPTSSVEDRPQKRMKVAQEAPVISKPVVSKPVVSKPAALDLSKYKLKKLTYRVEEVKGAGNAVKGAGLVENGLKEGDATDLSKVYVWYASYGSNLLEERLLCYIKGGKTDSTAMTLAPCSDATPPTATEAFIVPHRLFFAHAKSVTWGAGGVSFITSKDTPASNTIVRAYRITLEQFNEVARKENSASAPVGSVYVAPNHLVELRKRDEKTHPHGALDSVVQKGKYRTVKYLGDYKGEPVLTFTASHKEQEEVTSGHVALNPPSEKYRTCIVKGLVEVGLSQDDAEKYVDVRASTPLSEATG